MIKLRTIVKFIFFPSVRVMVYLKLLHWSRARGKKKLAFYVSQRLRLYGLHISPKARIAKNVRFRHPTAIVIGEGVVIEDNVIIYQSVTLGGSRIGDATLNRYPVIKKNSVIFSGAAVIGEVIIGEACVIGANSVVTKNIPDFSVAVGAPARIIKNLRKEQDMDV